MKKRTKDPIDQASRRFVQLKEQFVAKTGLEPDSPRAGYLAVLMLRAEQIQSRAIAGDDVSTAELLALRQTIEEMSPEPMHEVRICVVPSLPPEPEPERPPSPPLAAKPSPPVAAVETKLEAKPSSP